MIKKEINENNVIIRQHQFGYISINMEYYLDDKSHQNQRTLLAVNVYVFIIDQTVWILDTGYNDRFDIPFINSKLKSDFMEIITSYRNYKDVNILLSHFHPDHSGGLIKYFDLITALNWRIFYNQRKLDVDYYKSYPDIFNWLKDDFSNYTNKIDINRQAYFKIICQGGHTPDHVVLSFADNAFIYPADIMPTAYHIQNLPTGEKNANQALFIDNRTLVTKLGKEHKSRLLLAHAPNNGFHQI